jgi:hypothetical protein
LGRYITAHRAFTLGAGVVNLWASLTAVPAADNLPVDAKAANMALAVIRSKK